MEAQQKLTQGVETLIAELGQGRRGGADFDIIIIGSGYGGAVAASRLARARDAKGRALRICVLERGREFLPGDFPDRLSDLPGEVRWQSTKAANIKGKPDGLFDLHWNDEVSVLRANGFGGGSLINASVTEAMDPALWADPAWPQAFSQGANELAPHVERALSMLDAHTLPRHAWTAKTRQLAQLGRTLDATQKTGSPTCFRPVKLALNQQDRINRWQIEQKGCVGCGDCFTGCNFNAKNTLTTNYLPDAQRFGARLFTGANVLYLQRGNKKAPWQVHFGITSSANANARAAEYCITARIVILAAGTLGSSEILLRSQSRHLPLSKALGTRFSGNGDMIWAGYRFPNTVNPGSEEATPLRQRKVGPTITAMLDLRHHQDNPQVIQDAAIPAAMYRAFGEIITTSAMLHRMAHFCPDESGLRHDPDALDPVALQHTAVYLSMGRDSAAGQLQYVAPDTLDARGKLRIVWQHAAKQPCHSQTETLLGEATSALNGTLLSNPLWHAFPRELDGSLAKPKPEGSLITVHPLGGCPMADHAKDGVVDHAGRVFTGTDDDAVHPGLYVWDGSIIPMAIGINPLLTITALAERAVILCAHEHGWHIDHDAAIPPIATPHRVDEPPTPPRAEPTRVRFQEIMRGNLLSPSTPAPTGDSAPPHALTVNFFFQDDLLPFLARRDRIVRISDASLTLPDGHVIALTGKIEWLHLANYSCRRKIRRAMLSYVRLRAAPDLITRFTDDTDRLDPDSSLLKKVLTLPDIVKLASHTGGLRELRYTLAPRNREQAKALGAADWVLHGVKKVEYQPGNNIWRSLSNLDVHVTSRSDQLLASGILKLDWHHLLSNNAMQIVSCTDNTYAWQDLLSMGAFFIRAIFRIHFWSFRKPDYQEQVRTFPRPGKLPGLTGPRLHTLTVTDRDSGVPGEVRAPHSIELRSYHQRGKAAHAASALPPVMLIHGFGASGLQYTTPELDPGLTQFLCQQGREVWVLELRTSVALETSKQQWTLDEIAQNDIPAAVRYIVQQTGHPAIDVMAHCIGSAMFNIAVLSGRLQADNGQSLIRAAVMLQVGPIFKVSHSNLIRADFAKLGREMMNMDSVDSSVDRVSADWKDALLDRLLASHPIPPDQEAQLGTWHLPMPRTDLANYFRSTGVFGRLFQIENVNSTLRNGLGNLLGRTNMRTYRQILHCVLAERLVDQFGRPIYVTDANLARYYRFPALFLHGEKNDVFDPQGTRDSVAQLQRLISPTAFVWHELKGFGHLDPLIGIHAATQVFPHISRFLAAPPALPVDCPAPEPDAGTLTGKPVLGPILGWTRSDPDGKQLRVRLWVQPQERLQAIDRVEVMLQDAKGTWVADSFQAFPVLSLPGLTVCVGDVVLPASGEHTIWLTCRYHGTPDVGTTRHAPQAGNLLPPIPTAAQLIAALHAMPAIDMMPSETQHERQRWLQDFNQQPDDFVSARLHPHAKPGSSRKRTPALCLALGSCRYSGTTLETARSDQAYAQLLSHLEHAEPVWQPAMALLMGDQIYLDATAGVMDLLNRPELVLERYRDAWSSPSVARVMRQLPCYPMLDDHEISNDWEPPLVAQSAQKIQQEALAQAAFVACQWAFGPRHGKHVPASARHLYYDFEVDGFPFFVMDTRSERSPRHPRPGSAHATIVNPAQMTALANWLAHCQQTWGDRPKCIVSPSAICPLSIQTLGEQRSQVDGWYAYPESLRQLADILIDGQIRNVVMLSGDLHASFAHQLTLTRPDGQAALLHTLVISPLYAPYAFINTKAKDVVAQHQETLPNGYQMRYDACWQDDHYQGFALMRIETYRAKWRLRLSSPDASMRELVLVL